MASGLTVALTRNASNSSPKESRRYDPISRAAQSTSRRGAQMRTPPDYRDEPLRTLVRVVAGQAARELFSRELAAQRSDRPEVTVQ
jgi:hypothetical protein